MTIQCPNCMGAQWLWMRYPTGDMLVCCACGCMFAVIGMDGHAVHITTQAPKTIGTPDTAENLGGKDK